MPTNDFQIEVQPEYLPEQSVPEAGVFRFSYTITVTNAGRTPAQLIARHWIISDSSGHTEEIKGLGVIGRQPLLQPGEAFQYSSSCELRTPSGTMHGSYLCVTDEGEAFTAPIRLFLLEALDSGAGGHPPSERVLH